MKFITLSLTVGLTFFAPIMGGASEIMAAEAQVIASISGFSGSWVTDDNETIILIEQCDRDPRSFCGYVTKFKPTRKKLENRSICDARLVGGLKPVGNILQNGWVIDPESDSIYNLEISLTQSADKISLRVYQGRKRFGETVIWTRAKNNYAKCNDPS